MYATSFDVQGFKVWKSNNLNDWECLGICLNLSNSWGYKNFWAPEVLFKNGKYIMHYTTRSKKKDYLLLGVAVADRPEGPFINVGDDPMFDFGYPAIDGHVLQDRKNNYLFFSKDCSGNIKENGDHVSEICVCELSSDLINIDSEPKVLFGPNKTYDSIKHKNIMWNEAPYVIKDNGKYYLTYSANYFASDDYCVCLAIADNPMGPYTKQDDINPILKSKENGLDFSGPGHSMFFKDFSDNLKMVCHIQTNENSFSQNRKAVILDACIDNNDILLT